MSDFQDLLDWLRGKDSWISTPYGIRIKLQHLFDTQYQSDSEFPAEKKLLYIKELFFCGLEPLMLTAMYRQECIDFGKQDLFADMGTGVLSLIKKLFTSGLPELDIHNPRLWSQSDSDSPREIQVHDAIVQTIGNDPAILGEKKDLLLVRRRIYTKYCHAHQDAVIVANRDPVFDKIDDTLLDAADSFSADLKKRYFEIEDMVEDLRKSYDPEYKQHRAEQAQKLLAAIEAIDIATIKTLPVFPENIEKIVDIKTDPKKWLYTHVCKNRQIYRDLKTISDDIPYEWYI